MVVLPTAQLDCFAQHIHSEKKCKIMHVALLVDQYGNHLLKDNTSFT